MSNYTRTDHRRVDATSKQAHLRVTQVSKISGLSTKHVYKCPKYFIFPATWVAPAFVTHGHKRGQIKWHSTLQETRHSLLHWNTTDSVCVRSIALHCIVWIISKCDCRHRKLLIKETAGVKKGIIEAKACPLTVSSHYFTVSVPVLTGATCHHWTKGGHLL